MNKSNSNIQVAEVVNDAANDSKAVSKLPLNEKAPIRFGLLFLVGSLVVFLLWAAFAPLDAGVPSHGQIVVESKRQAVQHLRGGIVKEILVRDGDLVKAGQPLVKLDATTLEADLGVLESQYRVVRAVEARLLAEREGLSSIKFPDDLTAATNDIKTVQAMSVQSQLFQARRNAEQGKISILEQQLAQLEAQIRGSEAAEKSKSEQIALLKEELGPQRELAKEGYVPRSSLFDRERALSSLIGARTEDLAAISRARSAMLETQARMLQTRQEFQQQLQTQLTDIKQQVDALQDKLQAARADLDRLVLKSPVEGVVVGSNVHTVGGVVTPADRLMEIVPKGVALVVDAKIEPHVIDRVKVGLPVELRFSTVHARTSPIVEGKLARISADAFTDQRSGATYYTALVNVTPEALKTLGHVQLTPGMPVEVVIKTGERTFLNYLFRPITDRLHSSLREE